MFKNYPYYSLHNHSHKSNMKFPDSICKEEGLIDYAYELGLSGVALTDHDCISGYVRIVKHLAKRKKQNPDCERWQNFKLIFGNEPYLCRNGMNKENYIKGEDRYFHFILLALDEEGNKQIRELSSRAWKQSYMYFHRRTPTYYSDLEEIIGDNKGHIVASSACLGGFIPTRLMEAKKIKDKDPELYKAYYEAINMWIDKMISIFGEGNFYLECQPGLHKDQIYVNQELLKISKERGDIKCIITTDSHYLKAEDREIHKAYLNSKEGDREVDDFYEAAYMMSSQEMWDRVKDYMSEEDFKHCLDTTVEIGNKAKHYTVLKPLDIPYIPLPHRVQHNIVDEIGVSRETYPSFLKFWSSEHEADNQLATRVYNFIRQSVEPELHESKLQRLERELSIIWDSSEKQNTRWSRYLLQMSDYCDIIWQHSLICPGRGSGGAAYILYVLGITQVDPTRETAPLLFERFMNPERASVLDIDIDVESTKRDDCIEALREIYGHDRVARVATFKTEKSRSAILAAARGLKIDVDIARYIASLIGSERGIQYTLSDMYYGNEEAELKPNKAFIEQMNIYPEL